MTNELNRVHIDEAVTYKLQSLGRATGMTPNYIARIGLTYSLGEQQPPSMEEYDAEGKQFNRVTLLGEHDSLYVALVKKRMITEGHDPEQELEAYFLSHLNRGIETLSGRVSDLSDLYEIMPSQLKASDKSAVES